MLISDKRMLPDVIAYEIYEPPNLVGFQSATGYTGFYFTGLSFNLVIDGWSFSCHQICAHGAVVHVESQTWGAIKSLFK